MKMGKCRFFEACQDYLDLCKVLKEMGMVSPGVQNALDHLNNGLMEHCYDDSKDCAMLIEQQRIEQEEKKRHFRLNMELNYGDE